MGKPLRYRRENVRQYRRFILEICADQGLFLIITRKQTWNSINAKNPLFPSENAGFLGFRLSGR